MHNTTPPPWPRDKIALANQTQAYTGLKTLYLEGNAISRIEGLDTLIGLRCLYLGRNLIRKVEGLANLENLDTLDLHENDVSR